MIKKHLPLIVAIILPVIFIGILAVVILVPSMRISPQYDFVYIDTHEINEYPYRVVQYKNDYVLKDGKITLYPLSSKYNTSGISIDDIELKDAPRIYYYSVTENTSREISFEDAQALNLAAGPSSPDGYNVKYEYNNDGIFELFGSNGESGYVITKGAGQKNLTGMGVTKNYYSGEGFRLIGWVK